MRILLNPQSALTCLQHSSRLASSAVSDLREAREQRAGLRARVREDVLRAPGPRGAHARHADQRLPYTRALRRRAYFRNPFS